MVVRTEIDDLLLAYIIQFGEHRGGMSLLNVLLPSNMQLKTSYQ